MTKTKPKNTKQRSIHVEHVTNRSPFDKSMIDKSEDLNDYDYDYFPSKYMYVISYLMSFCALA